MEECAMTERERFLLMLLAKLASEGMGQRGSEIMRLVELIAKDAGIYFFESQLTDYVREE